jgi:hypothetical protein
MKNLRLIKKIFYTVLLFQMAGFTSFGQIKYGIKDNVNLIINGTSTLHDWDMKSSKGSGDATFVFGSDGHITGCTSLFFTTPVKDLKSEHSGLDKNAYKALKTDKNPNILFVASHIVISAGAANSYNLKCTGKLTVAGVAKETDLVAIIKLNPDKSMVVSGTKSINMVEWSVEPPSFMFGAMKTGKDIILKFDVTINK